MLVIWTYPRRKIDRRKIPCLLPIKASCMCVIRTHTRSPTVPAASCAGAGSGTLFLKESISQFLQNFRVRVNHVERLSMEVLSPSLRLELRKLVPRGYSEDTNRLGPQIRNCRQLLKKRSNINPQTFCGNLMSDSQLQNEESGLKQVGCGPDRRCPHDSSSPGDPAAAATVTATRLRLSHPPSSQGQGTDCGA
jgi:hypothetical protein